jgi:hypothetical protein
MSQVTQEQLDELAAMLTPTVARLLDEPAGDTTVSITCVQVHSSDDASIMRVEVRVRGAEISAEQEAKVAAFLAPAMIPPPT